MQMDAVQMGAESRRLEDARTLKVSWRKWGPYLSERHGARCARTIASQEMRGITSAMIRRVRAYRWGKDGLPGISDDH
jgi:hypothetical protein